MSTETTQEKLLQDVLNRVVQRNEQLQPGTPLAELKEAIEAALSSLPPLEFKEYSQMLEQKPDQSQQQLLDRAPEMVGWNADQIIAWVEELAKRVEG